MPPRRSNVSAVSATGDEGSVVQGGKDKDGINIEDLSMPRTMVQRLAKGVLPSNTQLQKDAITAFSKGATMFVNFLVHSSHAHTLKSQRKTISPADIFLGLRDTEFELLIPRLEAELAKYNDVQTAKRNEYRKKVREGTMGVSRRKSGVEGGASVSQGDEDGRVSKRPKVDEHGSSDPPPDDDETEEELLDEEEGGEGAEEVDDGGSSEGGDIEHDERMEHNGSSDDEENTRPEIEDSAVEDESD
ncbi:hypothetical protein MMC13_004581 [Lambiella insularis]|nr:hypothetical protein [Lambiella insularis]